MTGLTLGGGVGISGHCSVRIVTETSQIGMPETAIGLCPDVGGLYLFARAPGELGTHAALTGARFGPADAMAAGLADLYVPAAGLAELTAQLRAGVVPASPVWCRRPGPCSLSGPGSIVVMPETMSSRSSLPCWAGRSRQRLRRRRCWRRCRRRRSR